MFIDESMKPKSKVIAESNLDWIFNFDENMQVCGIFVRYFLVLPGAPNTTFICVMFVILNPIIGAMSKELMVFGSFGIAEICDNILLYLGLSF